MTNPTPDDVESLRKRIATAITQAAFLDILGVLTIDQRMDNKRESDVMRKQIKNLPTNPTDEQLKPIRDTLNRWNEVRKDIENNS